MEIERIKIVGFKSFVDPVELEIPQGLTGIVGPNGCGKSNLVEALRWVMGESSSRNIRASAMDEVIFSGSQKRPERSHAQVTIEINNQTLKRPLPFIAEALRKEPVLEVSRRINRDFSSTYLINGRVVRARDVQLLFADASTGARASALVKQGQITELINAKPTERRILLEEAAGICGLYGRRHEAELRLQAADQNLLRLDDILKEINGTVVGLESQAKRAKGYRKLSNQIRQKEIAVYLLRRQQIIDQLAEANAGMANALELEQQQDHAHGEAIRHQIIARNALPGLRHKQTASANAVQQLKYSLEQKRVIVTTNKTRQQELSQRIKQITGDIDSVKALISDQDDAIASLESEKKQLLGQINHEKSSWQELQETLKSAKTTIGISEKAVAARTELVAAGRVKRDLYLKAKTAAFEKENNLRERVATIDRDIAQNAKTQGEIGSDLKAAKQANQEAAQKLTATDKSLKLANSEVHRKNEAYGIAIKWLNTAQTLVTQLQVQETTLTKILANQSFDWRPIVDDLTVDDGYEQALGVALGDDLLGACDDSAPMRWCFAELTTPVSALPEGAVSLIEHVRAPEVLNARLGQIGVVDPCQGKKIANRLAFGQRLVSKQGDLWRWDGYRVIAGAPSAATLRLEQRNKLAMIRVELENATPQLKNAETEHQVCAQELDVKKNNQQMQRLAYDQCQDSLTNAKSSLHYLESEAQGLDQKLLALKDKRQTLLNLISDAGRDQKIANAEINSLADHAKLEEELTAMKLDIANRREIANEAQGAINGFEHERKFRTDRLNAILRERTDWRERTHRANHQQQSLEIRKVAAKKDYDEISKNPNEIADEIANLQQQVSQAKAQLELKNNRLVEADKTSLEADGHAQEILAQLSNIREDKVRFSTMVDNCQEKRQEIEVEITDKFCRDGSDITSLEQRVGLARMTTDQIGVIERALEQLNSRRDQMGGVNLRAEIELDEHQKRCHSLEKEQQDLTMAIDKLRGAIKNLNKEGRERLLAAFSQVNARFTKLFTTLFNGGTAHLELIEADDPLNVGLEVIATPPGKRARSISLLSGGEQTLTCIALIFAVFITNPAPICILDEVDAPLDDANIDRFCSLLDEVWRTTGARFLVATHNPITMSRMTNLYGVTMIEKGVSRVLSVNLEAASQFSNLIDKVS